MPIIVTDNTLPNQPGLFGQQNHCRIEAENGAFVVFTPFNAEFVATLKSWIPANLRSWNPAKRAWQVDPSQGQTVIEIIKQCYGETLQLPIVESGQKDIVSGTFAIEYIGRCKPRGEENIAFGLSNNAWNFIFSETVLRKWFERADEPEEKEEKQSRPKTFYQILRVKATDTPVDIKKGYYRLARQWHPDVCREQDARDRFEQIKAAYDILSNPQKRKRYDLGLKLQKQVTKAIKAPNHRRPQIHSAFGYSPDLRCGLITLAGHRSLGKIIVENISAWEDIENDKGEFLVASWNLADQCVEKMWVNRNVIF